MAQCAAPSCECVAHSTRHVDSVFNLVSEMKKKVKVYSTSVYNQGT